MATVQLDRVDARDGTLPPVCAYCGGHATTYRGRTFFGTSPFTMFLGWSYPKVRLPLCMDHVGHRLKRCMLLVPFLVGFLAVLALLATMSGAKSAPIWLIQLGSFKGVFVIAAFALFAMFVTTLLYVFYTDIRAVSFTKHTLTVTNVADGFALACTKVGSFDDMPSARDPTPPVRYEPDAVAETGGAVRWAILGAFSVFLVFACGIGIVLVILLMPRDDKDGTIHLSNPLWGRAGLLATLNFDCHVDHTKIDSEREYFLVVRARNGMRKQRGFYGRDLLRLTTIDVTLDLGFPGNPPLPGGPVSRSLKDQSLQVWMEQLSRIPGGDRERVSNILSVR